MTIERSANDDVKRNVKGHCTRGALAVVAVAALGFLVACAMSPGKKSGNARVPEPAKQVDLDRYAGHWFEFARYDNRFERGCDFVTADYAKREDGLISVINACRVGGTDGTPRVARGKARVVPESNNAKLKVSFFGPFYVGDYWVLDHADDYQWSIVGEPSGAYLWILTREEKPPVELQRDLLERVRVLGYDVSMVRRTQH